MHKPVAIFSALTAGLALSVVAALPASAAVVTSDVPAFEFVDLTNDTFVSGYYLPLVPAGPVVLPAAFAAEDEFAASGISAGPAAAGCTRVVNSATIEFTTEASDISSGFQIVFATGAPAEYLPGLTFDYEGDGEAELSFEDSIVNVSIPTSDAESTSSLTIVPATPGTDETVLSVLGAFAGAAGAITGASFNVTDTCPDAAAPAAALPNMGAQDAAPLALVAVGALVVGGFALVATRRRAQH